MESPVSHSKHGLFSSIKTYFISKLASFIFDSSSMIFGLSEGSAQKHCKMIKQDYGTWSVVCKKEPFRSYWQAGQGRRVRLCEAVPTVRAVRSGSDGGDQTEGVEWLRAALLLSAAVRSPKLRQAWARGSGVTGVRQRGRGRHDELNGGEEAMNPRAEKGERRWEGLGRARVTSVSHSDHGEGT
jgi:hypothetical protein